MENPKENMNAVEVIDSNIDAIKTITLHKKMKFSIKDFFSKCDQIRSFIFSAVSDVAIKRDLMKTPS